MEKQKVSLPPHSPESESALVGALILDPPSISEVSKIIAPEDFYLANPRLIYKAILSLWRSERAVDLVTVKDELVLSKDFDRVGIDYLASTVETTPSAAGVIEYARNVRNFSNKRRISALFFSAGDKIAKGEPLNGEVGEIQEAIKRSSGESEFVRAEDATALMSAKIPPPDYIIKPLATVGRLTLLQGEPKGGKSCFSLLSAIAGSLGIWPCGRWEASGRPRKTVFITYEDDRSLIQERINQYIAGMSEPFKPLLPTHLFVYCDDTAPLIMLETLEGVNTLRKIIEEHQAEFVVVDTFSHLTAADENLKKEMQPVMNALNSIARELKVAILVIHHSGKPQKDSGKSMVYRSRGSSAIPAGFVGILDWGENASNLTQCRFVDKRGNKDKFVVEYIPNGDMVSWRLVDAEDDDSSNKYRNKVTIQDALARLIVDSPTGIGRAEIAKETGISKTTVIQNLDLLVKDGSIQTRQIEVEKGKKWVYAPITYNWI